MKRPSFQSAKLLQIKIVAIAIGLNCVFKKVLG